MILVSLVTSIILARQLGTDRLGVYAVVISVASLSVSMVNTGIGSAITYFIARRELELADAIRKVFGLSLLVAGFATVAALTTLLFSSLLFPGIPPYLLLFGIVMIPIIVLSQNFAAIFAGMEDFVSNNLLQLATQFGVLIFTIIFVWILPWGVSGGIASVLAGNLLGLIIGVLLIQKQLDTLALRPMFDWAYFRRVTNYGCKTQVSYLAIILNYRADIFLLNWFTGSAFVGVYSQAVQVGEQLWVLSRAVAAAVLPRIAAMEGFEVERTDITSIISRYILWVNLLASLVIYVIAEPAIVLLYGEDFRASATILIFLLPGLVLLGTARILSTDIAGRGKPGINGIHSFIAAFINIVLNIIMIPRYGFIGSAIATSISYSLIYVFKLFAFRKLTNTAIHQLIILRRNDIERLYRFIVSMTRQLQ